MSDKKFGTILTASLVLAPAVAFADEPVSWTEPSGTGFSMGIENGSSGGAYSQAIRFRLPLGDHWALTAKTISMHTFGPNYRLDVGGRLGFLGGSRPVLNILRVYGGGGVHVLVPATGAPDGEGVRFGVGGEVGIEAFLSPGMAAFMEVGGQGSFAETGYGSGATVYGGFQFYF